MDKTAVLLCPLRFWRDYGLLYWLRPKFEGYNYVVLTGVNAKRWGEEHTNVVDAYGAPREDVGLRLEECENLDTAVWGTDFAPDWLAEHGYVPVLVDRVRDRREDSP